MNACHDHLTKFDFEVVPLSAKPDVILLAGLDDEGSGISAEKAIAYKIMMAASGKNVKIVMRVNENDARKGTTNVDARVLSLLSNVDAVVFVSSWLQAYYASKGYSDKSTVIVNGVNSSSYKPNTKFNNGKLNIVTHHWSNNQMKGFDVYETIDRFVGASDAFSFTYIGRHRNTFKHTRTIEPLYGDALGSELGRYDVYVSGSRWDPGPNHVLESIACGLPTYVHRDGGGSVEFAGTKFAYSSMDELVGMLKTSSTADVSQQRTIVRPWETCVSEFANLMRSL